MTHRKAKTAPKTFITDQRVLRDKVEKTMERVAEAVGRTMGPGGRNILIESDYPGIPNKNTKDGVTVFKSLGAIDAYEHLIIEQARDVAQRTAVEAGDGTTTATVLANSIIQNLFSFCDANPKYSPQKAARRIQKVAREMLVPFIKSKSIQIGEDNQHLLRMVANISANGDGDMADAVMKAFEEIGYGDASHVTIRELSGPQGYKVERIDGFPMPVGYEDSIGKLHTAFINDQGNQRTFLEKPLFLLYDGQVNDLVAFEGLLDSLGKMYVEEHNSDYKNLVIVAHGFSEAVLSTLAFNFANPGTLNVFPLITPMAQFLNSQTHFLNDLAAFTGSRVFGMHQPINNAALADLGGDMEGFECYRFRSTVIGDPEPTNVEVRADELKQQKEASESQAEKMWLEERIGKITNGIAKLTIYGGSNGELKEAHDRCEDAVCAVRSAITSGALPGGCRVAIDMAKLLKDKLEPGDPARDVLMPSLLSLPNRLLDNAGYMKEEISEILVKLLKNPELVYDIENQTYGYPDEVGLFDATKAVEQSLMNAVSIASVLGTMGGLVCHPRDTAYERSEAMADADFGRSVNNPESYNNEANERA